MPLIGRYPYFVTCFILFDGISYLNDSTIIYYNPKFCPACMRLKA